MGRQLEGRGFYVCPREECVSRLGKRLGRWFPSAEVELVLAALRAELERGSWKRRA